jgi:hypothetical protein
MAQPVMHVAMVLSPTTFTLGDSCTLTITATLKYTGPITIYTWPTIFHLYLAQRRHNFFCVDLSDDDKEVNLNIQSVKRSGFVNRQIGNPDDEDLVTFYPDTPITFTDEFVLASRPSRPLKPGHRYRFGLSDLNPISHWMHGTREDVLTTEKKAFERGTSKLILGPVDDVEFEVNQE